jgi:hypothetical protein
MKTNTSSLSHVILLFALALSFPLISMGGTTTAFVTSTMPGISLTVSIPAGDTTPPTVSISGPASGTRYTTAQTVTITATASDSVGVTKVEFYDGATLRATARLAKVFAQIGEPLAAEYFARKVSSAPNVLDQTKTS